MRVVDGYLPGESFQALHAALLDPAFPWEPSLVLSPRDAGQLEPAYNRQLVHGFYLDKPGVRIASPRFALVRPLVESLKPQRLLKVKLNLTTRQQRHVEYGLHVDTRLRGATTAIYYLNTNNGYTVFEDGRKVESVANRMVIFDAALRHTGASCTDSDARLVLNINFVGAPPPA